MAQEVNVSLNSRPAPAFDTLTLISYMVYLAGVSLATHLTRQPAIGFFLSPLPLLFYRLDAVRFMVLSLASFLLFFEPFKPGSNLHFFNTPDALFLVFVVLRLSSGWQRPGITVPWSGLMLPLYLFLAHGLAMTVPGILKYGADFYVFRDAKNLAYLALIILLGRSSEPLFGLKNIYRMLLLFAFLAAAHSTVVLAGFLMDGLRIITWNEVFIADAILMIAALLPVARGPRIRAALLGALGVCIIGLVATQTRGLWGSVLLSLGAYAAVRLAKGGAFSAGAALKALQAMVLLALAAEVVMRVSVNLSLFDFIRMRALAFSPGEIVDPYSSLGYRIHESLTVWEKRSWLGHGSGARLYLFFTQLQVNNFIEWWSIHSEYFEILHKYGFVGLALMLWFLLELLRRALVISLSPRPLVSALGAIALTTVLNHCIVSVTSGYIIRENVMLWLVLMVGIVHRYYPSAAAGRRRRALAGRS